MGSNLTTYYLQLMAGSLAIPLRRRYKRKLVTNILLWLLVRQIALLSIAVN